MAGPGQGFVRAEVDRHRRGIDPTEALLQELRQWILHGPDKSTLKLSKRGSSVKITAELNGEALDVLHQINAGRPRTE